MWPLFHKSITLDILKKNFIMTPATKLGGNTGITLYVRSSVDAWLGKIAQSHNCLPFKSIIMKLHESRMCPIDFRVKSSKVKVPIHQ